MAASDKLTYLNEILNEWSEFPLQVIKRLVAQLKTDIRFRTKLEVLEAVEVAIIELKRRFPDSHYEDFDQKGGKYYTWLLECVDDALGKGPG